MGIAGDKLATKQHELKQAVGVLLAEHPELADTASGQEGVAGALESMHVDAKDLVATITEYTCVYVLMITICNPKLKIRDKQVRVFVLLYRGH